MKQLIGFIVGTVVLVTSGCATFFGQTEAPQPPVDQKRQICLDECKKHALEWCKTHPGQCDFKIEDWCVKNGNC